ncbi:Superoxide dismutase [Cu-Zn] [Armadillidium nasatum]|uniref:superoxide dismutase n=1 Tax=Armadillidium nasatum TaxID=96803 RepID=A0A5N5SPR4_9CRUS|nr:Superoxide dismutase [Cu-Zn] [Armadillidium nasatum]
MVFIFTDDIRKLLLFGILHLICMRSWTSKISGLTPGLHGFHIHEKGDLGNNCKNAGGHFNPFGYNHGDPRDLKRHIGDLGNIDADQNGEAVVNIYDQQATLNPSSRAYVGDLAIVVHSGEDDLGRGGNAESLKTGNAGSRIGCGIIEVQRSRSSQNEAQFASPTEQSREAIVYLTPGSNPNIVGNLKVTSTENGVIIQGKITGLTPGLHGFHIHETGDLGNQCKNAGGHFNPFGEDHGGPQDAVRHVGDLGNILADETGTADVYIFDVQPSLDPQSQAYVANRAIVVHQGTDDLGKGNNPESLKTGNAGARDGCGVIEIVEKSAKVLLQEPQQTYPVIEFPIAHQPSFASVRLVPGVSHSVRGQLTISRVGSQNGIMIKGRVTGLAPGVHGFHIHERGDLGNACQNAGGHFNPFGMNHGGPNDAIRHVGDLGNILADASGTANINIIDAQPSLNPISKAYIGNLAIVIHSGTDDLGRGGNEESLKTGNAGSRVACGVIAVHAQQQPLIPQIPTQQTMTNTAVVNLIPGSNPDLSGKLTISSSSEGIHIEGTVEGLRPGLHGFHIHEKGDLGDKCKAAGGHFNPFNETHGAPESKHRHVGDLGNIEADSSGRARIDIRDSMSCLDKNLKNNILNLAIVIHALPDDLGKGGNPESLKTGNAGEVTGLSPGLHGFHIHENGDLGDSCKNAGGHFNPYQMNHGGPDSAERHVGDLGNIEAEENGVATIQIFDTQPSLDPSSTAYIGDRAFVVHDGVDDLGQGGNDESLITGNAGARVACGITVVNQLRSEQQPQQEVQQVQQEQQQIRNHGEPNSEERHVGDLGNILADENGIARIHVFDAQPSLDTSSQAYVGNRAIVVHASPDDLGQGGNPESLKTGNAGSRLGCGIILIQKQNQQTHNEGVQVLQRKKRELMMDGFFPNYFQDPFAFSASDHFSGKPKSARVKIVPGTSKSVMGDLQITAVHGGIIIKGTIFGLKPGLHGFHFHEEGDLGNECKNAAGHFNPFDATHGDIHDFHRHVGDLGNIKANSKGVAHVDIFDKKASLDPHSPAFVGHRTLVVHADKDDLGRGNNKDSKRTGNSGSRVGCGIVEVETKSHHGPHKAHSAFGSQIHHGGLGLHQGHGGDHLQHQGHGICVRGLIFLCSGSPYFMLWEPCFLCSVTFFLSSRADDLVL